MMTLVACASCGQCQRLWLAVLSPLAVFKAEVEVQLVQLHICLGIAFLGMCDEECQVCRYSSTLLCVFSAV